MLAASYKAHSSHQSVYMFELANGLSGTYSAESARTSTTTPSTAVSHDHQPPQQL
ncbi:hypothetical protein V7S43_012164 [Phytophthora oleae]|uniref:Uncharacterized protein n=1 Tax=Phytophthora oleae TaxID=2107226 RepID=A0ABD3F8S9_9STRA